jgi:fibronectin-binding autotransporter adhesin
MNTQNLIQGVYRRSSEQVTCRLKSFSVTILALLTLTCLTAHGQIVTYEWQGGDGDWSNPESWDQTTAPSDSNHQLRWTGAAGGTADNDIENLTVRNFQITQTGNWTLTGNEVTLTSVSQHFGSGTLTIDLPILFSFNANFANSSSTLNGVFALGSNGSITTDSTRDFRLEGIADDTTATRITRFQVDGGSMDVGNRILLGHSNFADRSSEGHFTVNSGSVQSSGIVLGSPHGDAAGSSVDNDRIRGVLNINDGTVHATGAVGVQFGNEGTQGAGGELNLAGGTLRTNSLTKDNAGSSAAFNFSGGTLAAYNGDAQIGSATAPQNVAITLTGSDGVIHSSDTNGVARTLNIYSAIGEDVAGRGLTFDGAAGGRTVLHADNTFTGLTSLNGGTLLVNGSLAGDVNVASGATLGGSGTINGGTIEGVLSPGNSIGTLTFGSALTLAEDAEFRFEFENANEAGTTYDQVVGPTLVLPETGNITLRIVGLDGHTIQENDSFTIFTGDLVNFDASRISIVNESSWEGGWQVSEDSLVVTAIPEPGTLVLLGLGGAALALTKCLRH